MLDIYNQQGTGFECQPLSQNNSLSQWLYMLFDPQEKKSPLDTFEWFRPRN
jgi:hypothetical protein